MTDQKFLNLTDHWYPDKIGGSCLYAYKLHRLLAERVTIETITLVGEASSCEDGMVVHKVLHKSGFLRNRKALREFAADSDAVWIVHSPWFFFHLFFAFGFAIRKRVVGIYHGPWYREYFQSASAKKNVFAKLLFTSIRYAVDFFYCVYVPRFVFLSENMYRATSEYLPLSKSKVHIIPMWTEQQRWADAGAQRKPFQLSTFRRLEPRMGLQDLIAALNRCDLQNYSLLICGDGPYRPELEKLIEQMGMDDRVKLLGWVTEAEKLRIITESNAVVIPSRSLEGFSLLALESLEQGTPVILTEAVGFYEYIRDLEQDYVKKIDLDDSQIAIQEFLSVGSGRTGLDRIETKFKPERIRDALLRIVGVLILSFILPG